MRHRYLRQCREIRVTQYEADVRMCDQAAIAIDDIGVAVLADLQPGDHVPDQFKIDFGDRDAGVASRLGHRQRHVRLRLFAEID